MSPPNVSGSVENNFFDGKISAIAKTFVMFTGDIEFDEMAEDMPLANQLGTNLGYAFIIMFVFLGVIVLMNLLNGIAIHDTREIMAQSEVYIQESRVKTLLYFERMISDAALFYPTSNKKTITFHQKSKSLDILCCKLDHCRYRSIGIKLTNQSLSDINDARRTNKEIYLKNLLQKKRE